MARSFQFEFGSVFLDSRVYYWVLLYYVLSRFLYCLQLFFFCLLQEERGRSRDYLEGKKTMLHNDGQTPQTDLIVTWNGELPDRHRLRLLRTEKVTTDGRDRDFLKKAWWFDTPCVVIELPSKKVTSR